MRIGMRSNNLCYCGFFDDQRGERMRYSDEEIVNFAKMLKAGTKLFVSFSKEEKERIMVELTKIIDGVS